ncbi:MAG: c-type cytochrome [Acidobacteriota bacterium]
MFNQKIKRFMFGVALALAASLMMTKGLAPATAQTAPPQQAQSGEPAATEQTMEQRYKNIQALKGVPASQMRPMMNYISASLGMGCADCHVRTNGQMEFEKDDNPHKKTARRMITMTMDINKQFFNGRPQVTCFTCHQGHDHPSHVPPLPRVMPQEPVAPPAGGAPKAEDILAKYTQAVGGKEAVEKIKTRVIKGVSVSGNNQSFPLEINFASPDKYTLNVALPQAPTTQKLNGAAGWLKNAREDRAMDNIDLARARSLAASLEVLQLKEPYPRLGVGVMEKVGDRDAYVLRGSLPDKRRVRYYFDKETGLLVRRVVQSETVIGVDPEQTDYEDYRDVDGVKVAHTIRTTYLDTNYNSTRKFTEVKHNAKVDDARFSLPAAKQ